MVDSTDGTNSTNSLLTNLFSGEYVINIIDILTLLILLLHCCSLIDTISIEQAIDITANFTLKTCTEEDSKMYLH